MDRIEQKVMMKYFFLKGHGSKRILKELVSTLQDNKISLSTIKNWLRRFKSGDLSGGDEEGHRRRLISLGRFFSTF
jgi:transposase